MSRKKELLIALMFLVFGCFLVIESLNKNQQSTPVPDHVSVTEMPASASAAVANFGDRVRVDKVIDGDTFVVGGVKVRYIGIDTPETVDPNRPVGCFGEEASLEDQKLVEGKEVILIKDISDKDKYDRLLRYVYLPEQDGSFLFVNNYLVTNGFAKADKILPDVKYSELFEKSQEDAKINKRGLWGKC